MSSNCRSGNFSSSSLGSCLRYSVASACGSSYPSNLVYRTDACSPSPCQLGSSLHTACGETICQPSRCQAPCVVPISCQPSCYLPGPSSHCSPCQSSCSRPRPSTLCNPCGSPCAGARGWSSSSCSLGYGAGSRYSVSCGPSGFRPLACGASGFPSLTYGSAFCRPSYLTSLPCQSSCYRPIFGSGC
ncbi:keratin-associated protein 13-1-like [Sorex araneus]|uniref:keratin-associated protein 13-1-like n=1 Tax=Sorex araneus TaxID=42254 RepID=UPI002433C706|nr:keratin-associated protein 13-1-like [Sorex araneus]